MTKKCPACPWEYEDSHYALDTDAAGNELVPYHGFAGRDCDLTIRAAPKKRPCKGSMAIPVEATTT